MFELPKARDGASGALVVSGAVGFVLGFTAFPEWQVAVETAQVIARIVTYPPDNPFFLYHVRLWTILHEIAAALLGAGVTELGVSKLLSGLLGMLSLQALTMIVFAFNRDAIFATCAAFVVFLSRAAELGGRYPIALMGTPHTYGAMGQSALMLTAGLLGSGCYGLGGLLLGFLPAIHPSVGIWAFAIVGVVALTDFAGTRERFRRALPWLAAGVALSAVSFALHLAVAPRAAPVDVSSVHRFMPALVKYWDGHRQPASLGNHAVHLNVLAIPLALAWLWLFRRAIPDTARDLLRFLLASGALAMATVLLSWAPPERVPDVIHVLMPLRVLNIDSMMFAAVVLGLVGVYRATLTGQIAATALFAALLLTRESYFWRAMPRVRPITFFGRTERFEVLVVGAVIVTALAILMRWRAQRLTELSRTGSRIAFIRAAAIAAIAVSSFVYLPTDLPRALRFRDRTHDPVFAAAAEEHGLLLTGNGLRMIQLRTRRPMLLDSSGFDGLAYSPEAAPAMLRILRDVYRIELLAPPSEPTEVTNQRAWESYSLERWHEIQRAYSVTQVMTDSRWHLVLPLVAETADFRLYRIP